MPRHLLLSSIVSGLAQGSALRTNLYMIRIAYQQHAKTPPLHRALNLINIHFEVAVPGQQFRFDRLSAKCSAKCTAKITPRLFWFWTSSSHTGGEKTYARKGNLNLFLLCSSMHALKMQPFVPPPIPGRKHLSYNLLIVGVQGAGKYCLHHQVRICDWSGKFWMYTKSRTVTADPPFATS